MISSIKEFLFIAGLSILILIGSIAAFVGIAFIIVFSMAMATSVIWVPACIIIYFINSF